MRDNRGGQCPFSRRSRDDHRNGRILPRESDCPLRPDSSNPRGLAMSTSQPPFATPDATPPKRGMGKGAKVALILGVIFGVLVLVCCGGMIGVVGFFGSKFTSDPAAVQTI